MIPNRVAIALQDAGWYIRSEIIWHKPNPMPESVRDRPTSAHEKIWLITKSKKYYYDADAIREPLASSSLARLSQDIKNQKGSTRANGGMKSNGNMKAVFGKYQTDENEKKHRQGMSKTRGSKLVETRPKLPSQKEFVNYLRNKTTLKDLVENTDIKKTTIEHWFRNDEVGFAFPSVEDWNKIKDLINDWTDQFNNIDYGLTYTETHLDEIKNNPIGKNKRNVWNVKEEQYRIISDKNRPEIIEYRDLPEHNKIREYLSLNRKNKNITIDEIEKHFGNQAGHHWFEKNGSYPSKDDWLKLKKLLGFDNTYDKQLTTINIKSGLKQNHPLGRNKRNVWTITTKPFKDAHFATFPKDLIEPCIKAGCPEGGVVLDPFGGSGTTGIVAQSLNRQAILIELNKDYINIANKRIDKELGMFSGS